MTSQQPKAEKTSRGAWFLIGMLVAMLVASAFGLWFASTQGQLPKISVHGWIAMGLGTLFSLLIGCGLMWLSFYSSRAGFDDRADPGRLSKLDDH